MCARIPLYLARTTEILCLCPHTLIHTHTHSLSLSLSLLCTLPLQDITDSALYILSEVYKDKTNIARSLVRIFFKLGSVREGEEGRERVGESHR